MSHQDITYVFRNGQTYAIHQGKVIAADADPGIVEAKIKQAFGEDPHADYLDHGGGGGDPDAGYEGNYGPSIPRGGGDICPECGAPGGTNYCPECGAPLAPDAGAPGGQEMGNPHPYNEPSPGLEMGGEAGSYMAKAVVTPNGLKGTVLGKVSGLWGDEVTVRLENGRIVKLPVGTELRAPKTAAAPQVNPIDGLERRLASTPDGTRESLTGRYDDLVRVRHEAAELIREGVSYADSLRLDQLVVTAEVEQAEIQDAVNHLDDVEAIEAPRSGFSMAAAHEAAGISREDASWLDHTLDEMIKEAEATDFTKLMDEGPEAFAAELPSVALADTGVTRQMASSFIAEKTAGIAREVAKPYMDTFLARVEECRRHELSTRKQTIHKEAATEEDKYNDLPDESLFL